MSFWPNIREHKNIREATLDQANDPFIPTHSGILEGGILEDLQAFLNPELATLVPGHSGSCQFKLQTLVRAADSLCVNSAESPKNVQNAFGRPRGIRSKIKTPHPLPKVQAGRGGWRREKERSDCSQWVTSNEVQIILKNESCSF